MSRATHTEEVAARWLLRRDENGWSQADQSELDSWLNETPEHRVAFWRLEHGWEKADRLAALGDQAGRASRPRSVRTRAWRPLAVAAAIAACLAVAVVIAPDTRGTRGAYTTSVGGRQTVPLADGTRVELNTRTTLRAAVGARGRAVWLDQGEAYFEVAHEASLPFVVHAGPRTITVLGTKFSVRREGDRVKVVVVEGKVKIVDTTSRHASAPVIVSRGDIVVADGGSTLLAAKSIERAVEELGWRQGRLTFDQVTLGEAAAEFNRYNRKQLVIEDADAAALRIGGSFEAGNLEAFTRLLQRGFNLTVEDEGDRVRISS